MRCGEEGVREGAGVVCLGVFLGGEGLRGSARWKPFRTYLRYHLRKDPHKAHWKLDW